MKISHLVIRNFKRFDSIDLDLRNSETGEVADQFLILGDNGTGKTTILQAVALCLARAGRRAKGPEDLDWIGWLPERYRRWGEPTIEMTVHFEDAEITATRVAAKKWFDAYPQREEFREPGESKTVELVLEGNHIYTKSDRDEGTNRELLQFQGRSYAAAVLREDPTARDLFDSLPGVFWFDQFRNLATPPPESDRSRDNGGEESGGQVSYKVGVARLREHLNRWQLAKIGGQGRPGHRDWLNELENLYKRVFPGRSFSLPEPMYQGGTPTPGDYYFILSDGNRTYDLEEMSAGEQAIFPMLYEFVRQQIRNSVVLIDEIDLNLHPPLAQALLSTLPTMGPKCQFLLTTHSEAVSSLVSPNQIRRLKGGRLCL